MLLLLENVVGRRSILSYFESVLFQISGFAGKYVKENGNTAVGRITGLDPAGPCFRNM